MGRRRKPAFKKMKMLASRVEEGDYLKFEELLKYRDRIKLQDMMNLFVVNYISGNIYLSGSAFATNKPEDLPDVGY